MASSSSRPANPLPRRTVQRRAASGAATPVNAHLAHLNGGSSYDYSTASTSTSNITSDAALGRPSSVAFGSPADFGGARVPSPAMTAFDQQHNHSSLTLSPRTKPVHRRSRVSRAASGTSFAIGGERSSLGLSEVFGLPVPLPPSSSSTHLNGGRSTSSSTPQVRPRSRLSHASGAPDTTGASSSASTSGILGQNGSILERSSSPTHGDQGEDEGVQYRHVHHSHNIHAGSQVHGKGGREDEANEDEDDLSDASTSTSWTLVDRMRTWRNDAINQHLYSTAIFWGSKTFSRTRDPHDGFWLAQSYIAAGMFSRAERVLTGTWEISANPVSQHHGQEPDRHGIDEGDRIRRMKGKGRAQDADMEGEQEEQEHEQEEALRSSMTERERMPQTTFVGSQASTVKPRTAANGTVSVDSAKASKVTIRLADISVACRYLAAQAMVKQEKWAAAMEMLGEVNPFKGLQKAGSINGHPAQSRESGDGGIKFEASMCHLRGLVQLHMNAADRAKECFIEALSIDVKCYESFEALVNGNMLDVQEEWNLVQGLAFREHTPEDAEFIRMMYSIRLKKYAHREEMERCGKALMDEYGLSDDPDVLYGLADELYSAMRYADCFAVTSRILKMHDSHAASMPLHLACMHHLPHLRSRLFLLAHELVDREPEAVTSWYAVGLWYFSGRRWEEARRYFGKALLIDNRFGPAWICFAHSFALEGEHDQAITAYSTAQRHFQGTHLPMLFIGMQYIHLSNIKAADEYLNAAFGLCHTDPLLLNERGVAAYFNEKYEEAIRLFESALHYADLVQSSPSAWATTYLNLGQAYRKLRQYEKALASFERVLEMDPNNAAAHSARGLSLVLLHRTEEAILAFHEALAVHPGEPTTTALLRITLNDALHDHPRGPTSMSFPMLSEVIAEHIDEEVNAEEVHNYGRVIGAGRGQGADEPDGGTRHGRRGGEGSSHARETRSTRARTRSRNQQHRQEQEQGMALDGNGEGGDDDSFGGEEGGDDGGGRPAASIPSASVSVSYRPPPGASGTHLRRDPSSNGPRYSLQNHHQQQQQHEQGYGENENEDSTEDSAMIEASQESDMID